MTSITNIDLNLSEVNCAVVVYAKQNDKLARHIAATLYDGASAWTPPAGSHPIIRFLKPDGTSGFYDVDEGGSAATTISGNVATMTIVEQALTVPGDVYMELNFYNSAGEKLTTLKWLLRVQASVLYDSTIISSDYYNVLTAEIAAALAVTNNPPYIDATTKNWMIWDVDTNAYIDSGYSSVGPYFLPSVSASGNISWTNNGGLTNPTTRNIKGPQGVSISSVTKASGTGAPGTTDVYNVNLDNSTVAGTFNVYNGADGQGSPGSATPLMDGTASAGSANAYSREDHVHPSDTSRLAKAGDTATGIINFKSSNLTDGTAGGGEGTSYVRFYDSADATLGRVYTRFLSNGNQGLSIQARRKIGGTVYNNQVILDLDSSGNPAISFSSAAAWLAGLGLGTSGALPVTIAQGGTGQTDLTFLDTANAGTNVSDFIASTGTNFTVSAVQFVQWGKLAMLRITATRTSQTGTSTEVKICALKSAYYPKINTPVNIQLTSDYYSYIDASNGNINIKAGVNIPPDSTYIINAIYFLA